MAKTVAAWRHVALAMIVAGSTSAASAQSSDGSFMSSRRFMQRDGEVIYLTVCQSCHMAAAQGAVGAGAYPALANDPKLAVAGYLVLVVVNGSKDMPPFGALLDDQSPRRLARPLASTGFLMPSGLVALRVPASNRVAVLTTRGRFSLRPRVQERDWRKCAVSGGSPSHRCIDSSQPDEVGAGKFGSAKQPTAMPQVVGLRSPSQKMLVPQFGQK